MDLNKLLKSEEKSFEIDGSVFKYKDATIKDENENWNVYYPEGKFNPAMYETFRLCLFTETPFTKEFINDIININKDWTDLSIQERFNFLSELKGEGIKDIKNKFVETNKSKETDKIVGN